jgi:hypothetical protein
MQTTSATQSSSNNCGAPPTDPRFLADTKDFTNLPPELDNIDWTQPISWGKYAPYPPSEDTVITDDSGKKTAPPLPLTPENTVPVFLNRILL